nr:MAG TPA: hypothetical protein [Bacteriophage sp.]
MLVEGFSVRDFPADCPIYFFSNIHARPYFMTTL